MMVIVVVVMMMMMMMNSYFTYKWHNQIYVPHYVLCAGLYKVALDFS
jgi:hypothetical protein